MKEKANPWLVLSVTNIGVLLTVLNLGTLNVALPEVSGHFQAGAVVTSWILLSYKLFNTILILVFGKLADIYGRRMLYLLTGCEPCCKNMGAVISTALSLMIVTSALPVWLKDAIYAGTDTLLTSSDSLLMVSGYRIAFAVMLVMTLFAIAASYLRGVGVGIGRSKR